MSKILDLYVIVLKAIMALLLAGMVVLVFGNVVMRYVFDSGISASDELARWFFVWMVFLGGIVGIRERRHLGVDSLVRALSPAGRRACFLLSHAMMIGASALLVQGSWLQTVINWRVAAPATGLSTGIFYSTGVVFGVSAIVILGYEVILVLLGRMTDEELIGVRETEEEH